MSAGKNIAIGCGVIILAMVLAGFLGFRWFMNHYAATWDPAEIAAWSEEIIGMAPPDYQGQWGSYTDENQDEAVLVFIQAPERGSESSLTMMFRQGQHDFTSIFHGVKADDSRVKIEFDFEAGEVEEYFATWGAVQVAVQLSEGYADGENLRRQIIAIVPLGNHVVALHFKGNAELLDRNIVQEMLDLIPPDWQPQDLPTKPAD